MRLSILPPNLLIPSNAPDVLALHLKDSPERAILELPIELPVVFIFIKVHL